jgi:23S rRNA (uracil1939-C5)-methyltransferase
MSKKDQQRQPRKTLTAEIKNLSHEGRGVTQINGKTVFIHGALSGETVKFYYTRQQSKYSEGQTTEVITPSPERIEPLCPYFRFCGGCSLQHLAHKGQLKHKQHVLREQLQHFAKTTPETWLLPIQGPIWQYRRKARLGVRYVKGKEHVLVGFRERNGRYITDMHGCNVLHPSVGERISALRALIDKLSINADIPQIEVAVGDDHAALIFRHLKPFSEEDLSALTEFGKANELWIYLQPGNIKSAHRLHPNTDESDRLLLDLSEHNITLRFHPTDFTQVNFEINHKMLAQALRLLDLQKTDKVLDLFCGLGNFSLPIARHCEHVTAVEGNNTMVERGSENAALNGLSNVNFYAADLMQDCSEYDWAKQPYDKLLLDPPRSGAQQIVENIDAFGVNHIVYISCNPATLARDIGILVNKGFRLVQAGIMDMFPHTTHVESIALLIRN